MLKIEIVDPNRSHVDRLEANGFKARPNLNYKGHTSIDFGEPVEVWTKDDGKHEVTLMDFGDLPEIEDAQ